MRGRSIEHRAGQVNGHLRRGGPSRHDPAVPRSPIGRGGTFLVPACLVWMAATAPAGTEAAGRLDSSFDRDGRVLTRFQGGRAGIHGMTVLPDGRIVAVGFTGGEEKDFGVARYLPDGSLDPTFDGDGRAVTDFGGLDQARDVVGQSDGKVVVGGPGTEVLGGLQAEFALVRYEATGQLDGSFGGDGKITTDISAGGDAVRALILQPDGMIVAAGFAGVGGAADFALARYLQDGSLDTSFGSGGIVVADLGWADEIRDAALQPDGSIVVGGLSRSQTFYDFALARYLPDGTLDPGFGTGGMVTTDLGAQDVIRGIALQADGAIVAAGYTGIGEGLYEGGGGVGGDVAVARYLPDGTLDPDFGMGGIVITDLGGAADAARGVAIQADGRIVVAGSTPGGSEDNFAVVRYLVDGSLDASFGLGGTVVTDFRLAEGAREVAIQDDGRIVAAGIATGSAASLFAVARYIPT